MRFRVITIVALSLVAMILGGCATGISPKAPTPQAILQKSYPELNGIENTAPPSVVFIIEHPKSLESVATEPFANEPVSISSGGGDNLSNLLLLAQQQITPLVIGSGIEDIEVGMLTVRKMPLIKFLRLLKARYDVGFEYDSKTKVLNVKKTVSRQIILPPIPGARLGGVDGQKLDADATLRSIVEGTAEKLGVNVTTISETTGLLHISGRPSDIESLCKIIETEATERLKYVTLHVMFIEFGVSNQYQKDFSLAGLPNFEDLGLGSDIFGTFRFSAPATVAGTAGTALSSLTGFTSETAPVTSNGMSVSSSANSMGLIFDKKQQISTLLTYLEQWGTTEIVTAPAVMTANGTPVSFDITDEIGYWEPGDLETSTSEFSESSTEGKPNFVSDEVGLKLRIRPKIMKDQKTGLPLIELDIALESSEVYAYAETAWQRSADTNPITLSKPLKSQKVLSSRAILRPDEMLLLAKLNKKDNSDSRSGLPGILGKKSALAETVTNRATSKDEANLYIVINAILPVDNAEKQEAK